MSPSLSPSGIYFIRAVKNFIFLSEGERKYLRVKGKADWFNNVIGAGP